MSNHTTLKALREKRIRNGYPTAEERAQERQENLLEIALAVAEYNRRKQLGLTPYDTRA